MITDIHYVPLEQLEIEFNMKYDDYIFMIVVRTDKNKTITDFITHDELNISVTSYPDDEFILQRFLHCHLNEIWPSKVTSYFIIPGKNINGTNCICRINE